MQSTPLAKIKARTASEVCALFEPDEDARTLLAEGMAPDAFLNVLIEHGRYIDAVSVLAHALPRREATWWACLGARDSVDAADRPESVAALETAEAWVLKPSDELGRKAMERAEAAGPSTPAGMAALAAFFSGSSISPPGYERVPPGETVTAKLVSGAILGAAYNGAGDPGERFRRLLNQGIDIAKGGSGRIDRSQDANVTR